MTAGNNRRKIPRNIKKERKVFSGLHKPLPGRKLKLKMSGPYKNENFTLVEIRKLVKNTK